MVQLGEEEELKNRGGAEGQGVDGGAVGGGGR